MSKGLLSYPAEKRLSIAMRRTQKPKEKGNGYWAAVGYLAHAGVPLPKDKQHAKSVIQSVMVGEIVKRKKGRRSDDDI